MPTSWSEAATDQPAAGLTRIAPPALLLTVVFLMSSLNAPLPPPGTPGSISTAGAKPPPKLKNHTSSISSDALWSTLIPASPWEPPGGAPFISMPRRMTPIPAPAMMTPLLPDARIEPKVPLQSRVIDLVTVTAPNPPGSRQLISPPAAVFEMAPANVLHGAVRLHGLTSSPTPETQVRVAWARAGAAANRANARAAQPRSAARLMRPFPRARRLRRRVRPARRPARRGGCNRRAHVADDASLTGMCQTQPLIKRVGRQIAFY